MKYLIQDRGYRMYMQGRSGSYSNDVGTAITETLPSWLSEKGNIETRVIKSDDPEFWRILSDERMSLERQISDLKIKLHTATLNLSKIEDAFKSR